jgi:hypothetical protein
LGPLPALRAVFFTTFLSQTFQREKGNRRGRGGEDRRGEREKREERQKEKEKKKHMT